jgi:DNA polymerase-3 subunit alpha
MQKGYGFSLLHGIEYTYILIQQLNLVYYYPPIFWNTGVLLVESGALEQDTIENDNDDIEDTQENTFIRKEKTTNYGTIAKAIGNMQYHKVSVVLPDINKADLRFKPDIENNEIIFGLKGIMKINNETSTLIMENRPFTNLEDFYNRMVLVKRQVTTKTGKIQNKSLVSTTQTIMLIKAGAFDKIENKSREEILEDFLHKINPDKSSINSTTIEKVIQKGIVPTKYKNEMRIYRFRNYLMNNKKMQDTNVKTIKWYSLDNGDGKYLDYAINFFNENFICEMEENKDYKYDEEGNLWVALGTSRKGSFDKIYKDKLTEFEKWLNSSDCLDIYNKMVFDEIKNDMMQGTISRWEMESVNFYYHDHELANIDKERYHIEDFNELPEEPIVVGTNKYKGRTYPKFQLTRIVGTVLDRDKTRHSVTLLTPTSVVLIKFYSGQFAFYDKQISVINEVDGKEKKAILEEGWFKRGNKLLVTGFRRGDQFKPKRYKNSIFPHSVQLITRINDDNTLMLQSERIGVNAE